MLGQERAVYIFEVKLTAIQPVSTRWEKNRAAFTDVNWSGGAAVWNFNGISLWISVSDCIKRVRLREGGAVMIHNNTYRTYSLKLLSHSAWLKKS